MTAPILVLSVVWAIPVAAGSIYFPLEPSSTWTYAGDGTNLLSVAGLCIWTASAA